MDDVARGIAGTPGDEARPAQGFGRFTGDRIGGSYRFSSDLGEGWGDTEVYHDPVALHEAALRMGVNLFVYAVTSRPLS